MLKLFYTFAFCVISIALMTLITTTALTAFLPLPSAIAAIQEFAEQPGQTVYQSRQTLKDQTGRTWQVIAFKRIKPDGAAVLNLRLVGFPGTVRIDRQQPLQLRNSLGEVLMAEDASSQMFSNADAPEPYIGQYDLQPILADLRLELPWRLVLPTESQEAVLLSLPSQFVADWQALNQPLNLE